MTNLNIKETQVEYRRIMANRIRFYAEKYDPHTVINDQTNKEGEEIQLNKVQKRRVSMLREIFTHIF